MSDLARDLRASVVEWIPENGQSIPAGTAVLVVLAGGEEGAALDLLTEIPPGPVPRYVVGASVDHRIAAAAVQRGARDYFALPDDLEVLLRSLQREGREVEGRMEAGGSRKSSVAPTASTASWAGARPCGRVSIRLHASRHTAMSLF